MNSIFGNVDYTFNSLFNRNVSYFIDYFQSQQTNLISTPVYNTFISINVFDSNRILGYYWSCKVRSVEQVGSIIYLKFVPGCWRNVLTSKGNVKATLTFSIVNNFSSFQLPFIDCVNKKFTSYVIELFIIYIDRIIENCTPACLSWRNACILD